MVKDVMDQGEMLAYITSMLEKLDNKNDKGMQDIKSCIREMTNKLELHNERQNALSERILLVEHKQKSVDNQLKIVIGAVASLITQYVSSKFGIGK